MNYRRYVALGVLVTALGAARRAESGTEAVTGSLRVERTWVFCDEDRLGSFVIGTHDDKRTWVKFLTKYRWLTATAAAKATTIRFTGKSAGPRPPGSLGDGDPQITDAEIAEVDGKTPADLGNGTDYAAVSALVFGNQLTDAARKVRFDRIRGTRFTDVGRIAEVNEDRRTMLVKFRDRTITFDATLKLADKIGEEQVEDCAKGRYVAVSGTLDDFTTLNDAVTVKDAEVAFVPEKTGTGW